MFGIYASQSFELLSKSLGYCARVSNSDLRLIAASATHSNKKPSIDYLKFMQMTVRVMRVSYCFNNELGVEILHSLVMK